MAHRLEPQRPRPTQVSFPWRATVRSVAVAGLALLPLLHDVAQAADIDTIPAVASTLAIVAAVQRVISLPAVDDWLTRYLGLGAESRTTRKEMNHSERETLTPAVVTD